MSLDCESELLCLNVIVNKLTSRDHIYIDTLQSIRAELKNSIVYFLFLSIISLLIFIVFVTSFLIKIWPATTAAVRGGILVCLRRDVEEDNSENQNLV